MPNTKIKIQQVDVRQDTVVIEQDGEFVDMSNPHGFVYGQRFVVLAITEDGRRFSHHKLFHYQHREAADALAIKVLHRGEIDLSHWLETYPVYGSLAWEDEEDDRRANLHHALSRGDSEEIDRWS